MFVVLETFGGPQYTMVCTNEDGEAEVFETRDEASKYAEDVQEPIIVEIN